MRSLHIACLPFPSPQGTQALIHRQLRALSLAGDDVHLLTYRSGSAEREHAGYTHEGFAGSSVSLRSGPSLAKAWADLRMVRRVRELARTLRPDIVVGHNVEGAAVARIARLRAPHLYMAHTRMDTELPTYFASRFRSVARLGGRSLDAMASAADHVAAVSPWLAERFDGTYVPPPWSLPPAIEESEREEARRALGLTGTVGVYAGNLDGYQDWRQILALQDRMTLVVATASDTSAIRGVVEHILPLGSEAERRRAHALADVALVPRGAPGGLPIKLIDALARGLPVMASRTALAGLTPDGVLAAATLADIDLRRLSAVPMRGRQWVLDHANDARFTSAMHDAAGIAIDKKARSVAKRRKGARKPQK